MLNAFLLAPEGDKGLWYCLFIICQWHTHYTYVNIIQITDGNDMVVDGPIGDREREFCEFQMTKNGQGPECCFWNIQNYLFIS